MPVFHLLYREKIISFEFQTKMRLTGTREMWGRWIRQKYWSSPFNANPRLSRHGRYGKMDGLFPHEGPAGSVRAHTNEYAPIHINRRLYGPEHSHAIKDTRKRLDNQIPGPLYIHRHGFESCSCQNFFFHFCKYFEFFKKMAETSLGSI